MRAVSFDLDGTLAEVGRRRIGLWRELLRWPRVLGAYEPAVRALRGRRLEDLPRALEEEIVARSGEPPERVRAALEATFSRRWPALFAGAQVPAPLRALIAACDARALPRAVTSDHPALDKLGAMGLDGWAVVIDCGALGAYKPLPDGLWAAAAQLGVPPSALTHVGDRWDTDGAAAAAAGCRFVHVEQLSRGLPDWLLPPTSAPGGANPA